MKNLMQQLADMQYQLQEAKEDGELEQFIHDQHEDLNRLLTRCMNALHEKEVQAA